MGGLLRAAAKLAAKLLPKVADDAAIAATKPVAQAAAKAAAQSADDVARAAAKPAAQSAAKAAAQSADDVAAAAAKPGMQAAAETAEEGGKRLSFLSARRIANGNESLISKLELLHKGGRDDLANRVIAQARLRGEINMDTARMINLRADIPDVVKSRVSSIAANRADPGLLGLNARWESVKAMGDYARNFPLSSSLSAVKSSITGAFSFVRHHPVMTAVGLGGAHAVTGGESSRMLGDAANATGRVVLGTTAAAIGAVTTPEMANAVVNTAEAGGKLALDAGRNSTAALATVAGRSVGLDVDADNTGGEISSVLGRNPVGRAAIDVVNAATRAQDAAQENGGGIVSGAAAVLSGGAGAAGDAMDALQLGNAIRDPAAAWNKLREAAANNPTMKRAMDLADQNPFLKWGLIGGFGLGVLGEGSPAERLGRGIKGALIMGVMADLIGFFWGKPSFIMSTIGNMMSKSSGPQTTLSEGMERALKDSPTTAPAATGPAATAAPAQAQTPAQPAIKSNFTAQASPPAAPELSANQQAFRGAVQPAAAPTVPAAPVQNDYNKGHLVYAPSTM